MTTWDRFAHLRDNLARYREATAARRYVWWCTECETHQADETGLCPLCRPTETVTATDGDRSAA